MWRQRVNVPLILISSPSRQRCCVRYDKITSPSPQPPCQLHSQSHNHSYPPKWDHSHPSPQTLPFSLCPPKNGSRLRDGLCTHHSTKTCPTSFANTTFPSDFTGRTMTKVALMIMTRMSWVDLLVATAHVQLVSGQASK